jgi:hypothetical protein
MNRSLRVRGTVVEDGQARQLVVVDGAVADAPRCPRGNRTLSDGCCPDLPTSTII